MSMVPAYLNELRKRDRVRDWRRDDPVPDAADVVIPAEAAPADRLEALALLAKSRLDAAAALEALGALAVRSPERCDWALREIWQVAQHWSGIEVRAGAVALDGLRGRAIAALRAVCAALPDSRLPFVSLAPILRAAEGVDVALDLLEAGIAGGAPVADAYLRLLADTLAQAPTAARVRRALAFPEPARRRAGFHWHAFEVHRAVAFASILAYRRDLQPALGPDALPAATADIEAAMARALASAATLPPAATAALFVALGSSEPLRLSPLPQAEAARLALVGAVLAAAGDPSQQPSMGRLLGTLNTLLPCTLRFWEDPAWRRACCRRIVDLAAWLDEPRRSWFRGKFGFAMEDYALAAEGFAAAAAAAPDAVGPGTYVDHRLVPERLAARPPGPLLGEEGGSFAVVADRPAEGLPTVIVAANDLYLRRYLGGYARGLASLAPSGHLHVHSVGDPGEAAQDIARLAATMPGHRITCSQERAPVRAPYYFATARLLRLAEWRERFDGLLAVTDIDSPWSVAPAAFLAERLGGADVGLALYAQVRVAPAGRFAFPHNLYPLPAPWVAVPAWMVALAPTRGARRFATLLAQLADHELRAAMGKPSSANWAIDQNILCAAYAHAVRHEPGIAFADVGWPSEARRSLSVGGGRGHHWLGRPSAPSNIEPERST